MDLTSARNILGRINRMFDDLDDSPSALERDLLREYIRRLYEALDATDASSRPARAEARSNGAVTPEADPARPPAPREEADVPPREARPAPPKPKVIHIPEEVEADIQAIEERRPAPRPARTPPRIIQAPADEQPDGAPAPRPTPAPTRARIIEVPEEGATDDPLTPAQSAPKPSRSPARPLSPELRELFAIEQGRDLSDRLAGQPITDLSRAFGINDTLVARAQLFGGDAAAFTSTLQHLNALPDYTSAVDYLGHGVAQERDWADDARRPAARTFVKLVRRRYTY